MIGDYAGRDLLLVPNDCSESEYLPCNGVDTVIRVAERWTPVLGKPATRRVVDDLHCPAELP